MPFEKFIVAPRRYSLVCGPWPVKIATSSWSPAFDLEAHRIQLEVLTDVHRNEKRHLRICREQQFFLQQEQIAVQIQHLFLQRLHVLIELPELVAR